MTTRDPRTAPTPTRQGGPDTRPSGSHEGDPTDSGGTATSLDDELAVRWQATYDPQTQSIIESLSPDGTWRCLDLGAGAGSMTYWLADRMDRGSVLAVDTDTHLLDAGRAPHLTVRELDVEEADFAPESFDFVLARAFFAHLRDPEEALRRALGWLVPGGWILVEDFYFLPSEHCATPAGRALVGAYLEGWRTSGADMFWGRRLPSTLARVGLEDVGLRIAPLGPGMNKADNDVMRLRMRQQGDGLVSRGLVSAGDLADFVASLDDPRARDVTTLEFSAWGRRPVGDR